MKRLNIITITILFLITSLGFNVKAETVNPPNVGSDSVVLMDATTGDILYGKNVDSAYPPASTTKTMTALLTLEKCKLDDVVTISNDFTNNNLPLLDGNTICIKPGEQLTVRDLLHGLLLRSANDAAVALAEHISGSVQEFAKLMNKRAEELGCKTAHFMNPNGLYNKDHKVSARDLALIMRELSKHDDFRKIASTLTYTIQPTNKTDAAESSKNRILTNENKMLYKNSSCYYEGAEGGKTGYTIQSLFSYVACASRNNHRLVVAFVHGKDKTFYEDAKKLFDYGFNNFDLNKLYSAGDKVKTTAANDGTKISLLAAEDFYYVSKKDSASKPTISFTHKSLNKTYFIKGDIVSNVTITLDGNNIGTLNLKSGQSFGKNIKTSTVPKPVINTKNIILAAAAFILVCFYIKRRLKVMKRKRRRASFKNAN